MGCFDTIEVYGKCPYCGVRQSFRAQTKDLGQLMYVYTALSEEWFDGNRILGRDFRRGLPVFPRFPNDKSAVVWKNQAERAEAAATVPDDFQDLKFVEVIAGCKKPKCLEWAKERDRRLQGSYSGFGRHFEGKIAIKDGKLIDPIFDIEKVDNELPKPREHNSPKVLTPEAAVNKGQGDKQK